MVWYSRNWYSAVNEAYFKCLKKSWGKGGKEGRSANQKALLRKKIITLRYIYCQICMEELESNNAPTWWVKSPSFLLLQAGATNLSSSCSILCLSSFVSLKHAATALEEGRRENLCDQQRKCFQLSLKTSLQSTSKWRSEELCSSAHAPTSQNKGHRSQDAIMPFATLQSHRIC